MHYIGVFKGAHYLNNSVGLTNMTQELIAQTFALASACNKPSNVYESYRCWYDLFCLIQLAQCMQPRVGDRNNTRIWFNGGKRIVRGQNGIAGQGVKKSRFADIRQANDSYG